MSAAITAARFEEIRELNARKTYGHPESAVAHVAELLEEVARLQARAADLEGDLSVARMAAQSRVEGVTDRANAKIFEVEAERDRLRALVARFVAWFTADPGAMRNHEQWKAWVGERDALLSDPDAIAAPEWLEAEKAKAKVRGFCAGALSQC